MNYGIGINTMIINNKIMTYIQGTEYMIALVQELRVANQTSNFFMVGELQIDYPGYKTNGDYRLSKNGTAPKHTDIITLLFDTANEDNFDDMIIALDDLYSNGLNSE